MTITMTEQIATEIIRDRTCHSTQLARPHHHRTARALRSLAERLDGRR